MYAIITRCSNADGRCVFDGVSRAISNVLVGAVNRFRTHSSVEAISHILEDVLSLVAIHQRFTQRQIHRRVWWQPG